MEAYFINLFKPKKGLETKRMKKASVAVGLLLFLSIALTTTVHEALCQDTGDPMEVLSEVLSELVSNPKTLLTFSVQLGLGFGLGYFSLKAIKHIVAIICILIVGVLLNIWQFGGLQGLLERLGYGMDFVQIINTIKTMTSLLGVLTILPIGLGFFVGVIIASRK